MNASAIIDYVSSEVMIVTREIFEHQYSNCSFAFFFKSLSVALLGVAASELGTCSYYARATAREPIS